MKHFLVIALALIVITAPAATACSICLAGDHSFFINESRLLPKGRLILSLGYLNTSKSSALVDEHHTGGGLEKPALPDAVLHESEEIESQVQNRIHGVINYGLSNRIMLMASIPYVHNSISVNESNEKGKGFSDPEISGFIDLGTIGNHWLVVRATAGVRVPVGESDLTNDHGERAEQHLQPGTGAWAGTLGLQAGHYISRVMFFASISYQANDTNDQGYRYGNVLRYNFASQYGLGRILDVVGELNGRYAQFDESNAEKEPHSGGHILNFSPGLRLKLGSGMSVRAQAQIPVVENLNGIQDEDVTILSGLIWEL